MLNQPCFVRRFLNKALSVALITTILLSMVMIGVVFDAGASAAETFTVGDYSYIVLNDDTARITQYTGTESDLTVPATLANVNVSEIGDEAFDNNDDIESLTISEGIKTIGSCAFRGCDCIEEVNIPSTVTSIGSYAFERCKALQSIEIPANVKSIGDRAFLNSPILSVVTLHEGLEKMGFRFLAGTAVTQIYIPTTVTTANEAFAEADYLETVVFGKGITAIPRDMFEDNNSLRALTIPPTVTKIGNDALCQMGALESIVIPDTVTELGEYVLYECKQLRSVTIGSGVTSLPYNAFSNCSNLTEVTIPPNVTTLAGNVFYNCSRLSSVTLNEGLVDIGSYAFGKTAITEVTIPASVTKGSYPFDSCSNLKTIRFADGVKQLLEGMYQNTAVENVIIPSPVTVLPSYLFKNCKQLKSVRLPVTLRTIDRNAFEGCTSLEAIDIPKSVKTIATHAFYRTTALKTCTFHDGLQTLGSELFLESALTSIFIPKTLSTTSSPFEYSNITDVTFSDGITMLTNDLFYNATKLTEVTLPDTLTRLGRYCLSRTNLEAVVIPDSVKIIDDHAFYDCDNLYAVEIGAGVRKLPEACFSDCGLLQNVYIPDTVTEMDGGVFSKSGLTYQKLPQSLLYIPYNAFSECSKLVEVECSDNLESIGDNAFKDCTSFTTLKTAKQQLDFNNSTFENCPKFTDKRFYVFNPAHTGIESTGSIGTDHTLVHFVVKYDIRDDWEDVNIGMKKMYLNLPDNLDIITTSFSAEGFGFDNNAYTGDYKSFDMTGGESDGELRFSAYLNNSNDALKNMSAEVEFTYKGVNFRKPIGDVQFTTAKLSLFAPSCVTDDTIVVSGYTATPNKNVTVTIARVKSDGTKENAVSYTVKPNKYTGKYTSDSLNILPAGKTAANEDEFEVYAECNGVRSDVVSFAYLPGAVRVTKAYESVNIDRFIAPENTDSSIEAHGASTYDITGIFTKGTSPVVVINPAKMMQFKIRLENDENISDMVLMSHKGNDWQFMRLYYDAQSDMWIGEGYFTSTAHHYVEGQNYVPGALNLFYYYGERKDTYRSHYYGSTASTGSADLAPVGDPPRTDHVFYYDKDGKPHGDIGDYHDTFGDIVRSVFIDIVTGDWKSVPSDVTVGGLKSLWQWGNTNDNLFRGLHHGYSIGPDGSIVFPDDRADMLNRNAEKDGKQRNAIDPSGIVYEAVEGNRIEGATATIYKFNEETQEWEVWNAADFEQENPLTTNSEGAYAWLTDEGRFKVTIEKEGYETLTSEEFDIPPEKLDLNFSLVDTATHPTATVTKNDEPGSYTLKFSKFMDPATVTTDTVEVDGMTDVRIVPVYLSEGDAYADTYTVIGTRNKNTVKINVTDAAQSYSGVTAEPASETIRENVLLGDVDSDGYVTVFDATFIRRQLSDLEIPFVLDAAVADADQDEEVTIMDATCLQYWLADMPSNDKIGQPV